MKLFVSYRSTDRSFVNQLVSDLEEMEHKLWYDQALEGGQNWWNNILEKIRWCDALVFVMTPRSLESTPCQREYTYANELKRHIIPVQIVKGIDLPMLPVILQERQIIDYSDRNADAILKLSRAIRNLPSPPTLPVPLPRPPEVPISPLAKFKEQIDQSNLTQDEQAAIVTQLKTYLNSDEFSSGARQLLERLRGHPALYAAIDRDIRAALSAPELPTPLTSVELRIKEPNLGLDDQNAILKQLSGYLNNPEYDAEARQLLVEFKDHPSLIAKVYKEIDNLLTMPSRLSNKYESPLISEEISNQSPEHPENNDQNQVSSVIEYLEDEELIREIEVSFMPGSIAGMMSGVLTSGLTTVASAAVRFSSKQKLQITNKRLLFLPSIIDDQKLLIPYDNIRDIRKVGKWGDPAIELTTKSGEVHRFSIVVLAGIGFGNREDLLRLIRENIVIYNSTM